MIIKSRRKRWDWRVPDMEEMKNAYENLVWNPKGKRSLGRSRCRLKDNIKMYFREIGWEDVDWIYLAQDRDR
jgi:hypothetical protein